MNFHTRKWIKPEDLNPNGSLFGGSLLRWIDEEAFGNTSLTMVCEVRNKITRKSILTIDKMVFVNVDEYGNPVPHGKTQIKFIEEQFAAEDN
jgi:acyl-CoA hydrolase